MSRTIFISHASEDKAAVARPLARALKRRGYRVWYDEFVLTLGDSLKQSIDKGLAECDFGIVILSPNFFAKHWAQEELGGLVARESADGSKVILPIWHEITVEGVRRHSPTLADKIATTSNNGIRSLVRNDIKAIEADIDGKPEIFVEYVSPFGARLAITARPNHAPSYDDEKFVEYFEERMNRFFSVDKIEKIIGEIEQEIRSTTLRKK